ncbi:hypothetical protein AAF712_006259 [Marasmius tenuissimus]|uniref:GST N-terminal domain-containing protein n=1 Tax=Marasmius tenuissimus TaxID=585030 RepID=A0ABR2ZYH3_9AGAR|nr:hypothetical protein PM082_021825 [Marasmius tenuissimus]
MITVYDLGPTSLPKSSELGLSPHVRKVILALRLKKLSYQVSVIGFDDIEPTAKRLGAPPTSKKPDGSPKYTIPFIHDTDANKAVSDSFLIAEYLDEAYPQTPQLLPTGTRILQAAFINDFESRYMPIFTVVAPEIRKFLSQKFIEGQKKTYGDRAVAPPLALEEQEAVWDKVTGSFAALGAFFGEGDKFVMGGETPTYADFAIASWPYSIAMTYGKDSKEWGIASQWVSGRVGALCKEFFEDIGV